VLGALAMSGLIIWFLTGHSHSPGSLTLARRIGPPGSVDTNFDCGVGADAEVRALALQPDGKLLVGGRFSYFDESTIRGLARLNPDGTPERTFSPNVGGTVHAVAVQADGRILLGGDFRFVADEAHARIARLNVDGTLDTTFNQRGALNREVRVLLTEPDGKILVGGSFVGGRSGRPNRITRLNADGTPDPTFNAGTGANRIVWSLAMEPDGKILAVGDFTTFDGHPQGGIVRLKSDGSLDPTFAAEPGADRAVLAVWRQNDGKILVAGDFTTVNETRCPHISRLLPDGTCDPAFKPGTGPDGRVSSMAVQGDGKILIAGAFRNVQDVPRNGIARLNADGSLDRSFEPGDGGRGGVCWNVGLQGKDKAVLVGGFTNFNSIACGRVVRLCAGY
jgi:uncharacterized delta-60 repeat protein